jgi:hypothetical protein
MALDTEERRLVLMSAQKVTPLRLPEDSSPTSDSVSQALESFQGIQSRVLHWVLQLLPWFVLCLLVVVGILILRLREPMFISGSVAAALSLFAFQVLLQRIPETLGTIWNRKLVAARLTADLDDASPTEEALDSTANPSNPVPLEAQYRAFVDEVEGLLNHSGQWLTAMFFGLLVGAWTFLHPRGVQILMDNVGGLLYDSVSSTATGPSPVVLVTRFIIGLECLIGFIIGLMAWRMVVIGLQVWRLGKKFDLTPQLRHPDRCGGFESLGNLCLWNALIVTVPAVFLGSWIILAPSFPGYRWTIPLFSKLLLVPMVAAAISFFLPLWSVHQAMVAKRAEVRWQLDQLGRSIDGLAREMLDGADELKPEEGEKMAKKLELMQQIYQQNEHYPVWPFNLGIMVKFATSQAVPLLSLSGLGQPVLKVIKGMVDFLDQVQ